MFVSSVSNSLYTYHWIQIIIRTLTVLTGLDLNFFMRIAWRSEAFNPGEGGNCERKTIFDQSYAYLSCYKLLYSYIGLPICFEIKIKRVCVQWTLHNCCNSCDHCNIYGHNLSFMVVFLIHSFMGTTVSNWKIFIRLKLYTYIRYVIVARFCIYILAFFHSSYFGVCTCTYTSRYLFSV